MKRYNPLSMRSGTRSSKGFSLCAAYRLAFVCVALFMMLSASVQASPYLMANVYGQLAAKSETGFEYTVTSAGTWYPFVDAEQSEFCISSGATTCTTHIDATGTDDYVQVQNQGAGFHLITFAASVSGPNAAIVKITVSINGVAAEEAAQIITLGSADAIGSFSGCHRIANGSL